MEEKGDAFLAFAAHLRLIFPNGLLFVETAFQWVFDLTNEVSRRILQGAMARLGTADESVA